MAVYLAALLGAMTPTALFFGWAVCAYYRVERRRVRQRKVEADAAMMRDIMADAAQPKDGPTHVC